MQLWHRRDEGRSQSNHPVGNDKRHESKGGKAHKQNLRYRQIVDERFGNDILQGENKCGTHHDQDTAQWCLFHALTVLIAV